MRGRVIPAYAEEQSESLLVMRSVRNRGVGASCGSRNGEVSREGGEGMEGGKYWME